MRIIASFYKHEQVMFVSHLDMQRLFQRAFRRADLPLAYSNGFNPHPLLSFATALSVGYTSDCEYFDVMLSECVSPAEFKRRVNAVLPQGVHIVDAVDAGEFKASLTPLMRSAEYDIELEFAESVPREAFYAAVDEILNGGEIIVSKKTKGGIKDVDIRPMLLGLSVSEFGGRTAKLRLRGKLTAEGGLSPELLLGAFYKKLGTSANSSVNRRNIEMDWTAISKLLLTQTRTAPALLFLRTEKRLSFILNSAATICLSATFTRAGSAMFCPEWRRHLLTYQRIKMHFYTSATSRTSSFPGEPCCRNKKIRMSVPILSPGRK